jgi:hypothetical protein
LSLEVAQEVQPKERENLQAAAVVVVEFEQELL